MNVCQNASQIFLVIQKLNHIYHSKLLLHYFLRVFSQLILGVYAYKDPVENQHTQNYILEYLKRFQRYDFVMVKEYKKLKDIQFSEFPNRFKDNVFAYGH